MERQGKRKKELKEQKAAAAAAAASAAKSENGEACCDSKAGNSLGKTPKKKASNSSKAALKVLKAVDNDTANRWTNFKASNGVKW